MMSVLVLFILVRWLISCRLFMNFVVFFLLFLIVKDRILLKLCCKYFFVLVYEGLFFRLVQLIWLILGCCFSYFVSFRVLFIVCCICRFSVFRLCSNRKVLNGLSVGLQLCSFFICVWIVKVILLNGFFVLKMFLKISLWQFLFGLENCGYLLLFQLQLLLFMIMLLIFVLCLLIYLVVDCIMMFVLWLSGWNRQLQVLKVLFIMSGMLYFFVIVVMFLKLGILKLGLLIVFMQRALVFLLISFL